MGIPRPVAIRGIVKSPQSFSESFDVDIRFTKAYEKYPSTSYSVEKYFSGDAELGSYGKLCKTFRYAPNHAADSNLSPNVVDVFGAIAQQSTLDVFTSEGKDKIGSDITFVWEDINSFFWFVSPPETAYLPDYSYCGALDYGDVFSDIEESIYKDAFTGDSVVAGKLSVITPPRDDQEEDLDPFPTLPTPAPSPAPTLVYYAPRSVALRVSGNELTVTFNAPLDTRGITGYKVTIIDEDGNTAVQQAVASSQTFLVVGGLGYKAKVASVYSDGHEEYSELTTLRYTSLVAPRQPAISRLNDKYTYTYSLRPDDAPDDADILIETSPNGEVWTLATTLDATASIYTGDLPETTFLYVRSRYRYETNRYSPYSVIRGLQIDNEPVEEAPAPTPVQPPPPPPPTPAPTQRFRGASYVSPYTALYPASTRPSSFDETIMVGNEAQFRSAMLSTSAKVLIIPTATINLTQQLSFSNNTGATRVRWCDTRLIVNCFGFNGNPFRIRGGYHLYNFEFRNARNTGNTNSGIFQVETSGATDAAIKLENMVFSGNNLTPIQCFISGSTPILCMDWVGYNFNTAGINNTNAPDALCNINTSSGGVTSKNVTFVRCFMNAKYCDDGADTFGGENIKFYDCAITNAGKGGYGGDGTGFKLGGARTSADGNECVSCLTFNSKLTGFDHNTSEGGIDLDRCVSYRPYDNSNGYPTDYEMKGATSGDKHTISRSIGREYNLDANVTETNNHKGSGYQPFDFSVGDFSIPPSSPLATQDAGNPIGVSDAVLDGLVKYWGVLNLGAF